MTRAAQVLVIAVDTITRNRQVRPRYWGVTNRSCPILSTFAVRGARFAARNVSPRHVRLT